ncbi:MAG: NCS2 family permease [Thermoanaerobaculia bacterium]|nr:NCS2 family permease [Thermoanaerobaculia bacterium]
MSAARWLVEPGQSWSWRGELGGGVTTFVTMVYIVVVNPAILAFAGIPTGPSTVATILAAAFGTLLMAFWARRPFAVAPYMGENAFLAFGLAALGIGWQQRLGAVFVAGALFLGITWLGWRQRLAAAIPADLKHAFAVAIGLFLAELGLYQSGIFTSFATGLPAAALVGADGTLGAPDVPVKLGDWSQPATLLAIAGIALTFALVLRGVRGAILLGMLPIAAAGFALGLGARPASWVALPFTGDYSLAPIALELDVAGVLAPALWPVLGTLALMGFLDTLGTLVALGAVSGLADERGDLPAIERPMAVDAVASMASALLGTSTSGAYVESATGIRDGARTGIASAVTALLFLATLVFLPVAGVLQSMPFVYAPALVVVGVLMLAAARRVRFDDLASAIPAFAVIALTIFTYNIANGIAAGLVLSPLARVAAGRRREVAPAAWALAAVCAAYFVWGLRH